MYYKVLCFSTEEEFKSAEERLYEEQIPYISETAIDAVLFQEACYWLVEQYAGLNIRHRDKDGNTVPIRYDIIKELAETIEEKLCELDLTEDIQAAYERFLSEHQMTVE